MKATALSRQDRRTEKTLFQTILQDFLQEHMGITIVGIVIGIIAIAILVLGDAVYLGALVMITLWILLFYFLKDKM
jgi:NhaP-type Na+/H+ or K+/H+ antiporter